MLHLFLMDSLLDKNIVCCCTLCQPKSIEFSFLSGSELFNELLDELPIRKEDLWPRSPKWKGPHYPLNFSFLFFPNSLEMSSFLHVNQSSPGICG